MQLKPSENRTAELMGDVRSDAMMIPLREDAQGVKYLGCGWSNSQRRFRADCR